MLGIRKAAIHDRKLSSCYVANATATDALRIDSLRSNGSLQQAAASLAARPRRLALMAAVERSSYAKAGSWHK